MGLRFPIFAESKISSLLEAVGLSKDLIDEDKQLTRTYSNKQQSIQSLFV